MTPGELKKLRDGHKIIAVARDLGMLKRPIDENSKTSYGINCPNTSQHSHGDQRSSLALLPIKNILYCSQPMTLCNIVLLVVMLVDPHRLHLVLRTFAHSAAVRTQDSLYSS